MGFDAFLPSGFWTWPFRIFFPMKNGDFPYVSLPEGSRGNMIKPTQMFGVLRHLTQCSLFSTGPWSKYTDSTMKHKAKVKTASNGKFVIYIYIYIRNKISNLIEWYVKIGNNIEQSSPGVKGAMAIPLDDSVLPPAGLGTLGNPSVWRSDFALCTDWTEDLLLNFLLINGLT